MAGIKKKEESKVPEEMFIVIGPTCWGKASTLEEAWKQCKKNWPKFAGVGKPDKKGVAFYRVPPSIFVNDIGGLSGPIEDHHNIVQVNSEGEPLKLKTMDQIKDEFKTGKAKVFLNGEQVGGTVNCDLCEKKNLDSYVDGATRQGKWGNMCLLCHAKYGVGLGIGKGQAYQWRDGAYVQVAGGTQTGRRFNP